MKIGIQFSQPGQNYDQLAYISKFLSWIQLAHQVGFESFWMGQHFLLNEYLLLQPLPMLARSSAITKEMYLGTSVLLLPLLNPLDVAEQGAVIDALTEGRFILGVGQGYRETEYTGSGIRREEIKTRFEESIEIIKGLWTSERYTYAGRYFSLVDSGINPRPVQRPRPPIMIGAHTQSAVRRAGVLGDGWIAPPGLNEEELSRLISIFRKEAKLRGTEGQLILMRAFHLTKNQREAKNIQSRIAAHFQRKKNWGQSPVEGHDDEMDFSIVGNADYCIEKIDYLFKRFRPNHLVLLHGFQGTQEQEMISSIKQTGTRVIPYFKKEYDLS